MKRSVHAMFMNLTSSHDVHITLELHNVHGRLLQQNVNVHA